MDDAAVITGVQVSFHNTVVQTHAQEWGCRATRQLRFQFLRHLRAVFVRLFAPCMFPVEECLLIAFAEFSAGLFFAVELYELSVCLSVVCLFWKLSPCWPRRL